MKLALNSRFNMGNHNGERVGRRVPPKELQNLGIPNFRAAAGILETAHNTPPTLRPAVANLDNRVLTAFRGIGQTPTGVAVVSLAVAQKDHSPNGSLAETLSDLLTRQFGGPLEGAFAGSRGSLGMFERLVRSALTERGRLRTVLQQAVNGTSDGWRKDLAKTLEENLLTTLIVHTGLSGLNLPQVGAAARFSALHGEGNFPLGTRADGSVVVITQ